jgi:hypothetical protein
MSEEKRDSQEQSEELEPESAVAQVAYEDLEPDEEESAMVKGGSLPHR